MPGVKGTRTGGKNRVPTALKLLRGNPGRRPLPQNEPMPPVKIPSPPRELSDRAKKEWRKLAKQLLSAGIVTELDGMGLAGIVSSYVRWLDVQQKLSTTGLLVMGPDGIPRANPLLRISSEAQAEFTRGLSECGMTPASRGRVSVVKKEESDDPMELILGGKA